jgi:hypothetical protein
MGRTNGDGPAAYSTYQLQQGDDGKNDRGQTRVVFSRHG